MPDRRDSAGHEFDCAVAIAELRGDMETQFAELRPQLAVALEGVGNFRIHAARVDKFCTQQETRWEQEEIVAKAAAELATAQTVASEKRQWKRSDKIAVVAIMVVCCLPPVGYIADKTIIFLSDVYKITQEWDAVHKTELQQRKSFFSGPDKVYANVQKTQDAAVPRNP